MKMLLFSRGEIFWTEDAEGDDQLHPGPEGQRALGICHCRRQGPGDNLSLSLLSLSCDNLSLLETRTRWHFNSTSVWVEINWRFSFCSLRPWQWSWAGSKRTPTLRGPVWKNGIMCGASMGRRYWWWRRWGRLWWWCIDADAGSDVHASMQFGEKLMIKFSAKLKSSLRWNERLANLNKLKLSKLWGWPKFRKIASQRANM